MTNTTSDVQTYKLELKIDWTQIDSERVQAGTNREREENGGLHNSQKKKTCRLIHE